MTRARLTLTAWGLKKRLAYETSMERRVRGQGTPDFAPWPEETTFQGPECSVNLEKSDFWWLVILMASNSEIGGEGVAGRLQQQSGKWSRRTSNNMWLIARPSR